jgi:hypothetical protein
MKTYVLTFLLIPIVVIALAGWFIFMIAFMLEKAVIAIVGASTPGPVGASINQCFSSYKTRPNNGW